MPKGKTNVELEMNYKKLIERIEQLQTENKLLRMQLKNLQTVQEIREDKERMTEDQRLRGERLANRFKTQTKPTKM